MIKDIQTTEAYTSVQPETETYLRTRLHDLVANITDFVDYLDTAIVNDNNYTYGHSAACWLALACELEAEALIIKGMLPEPVYSDCSIHG